MLSDLSYLLRFVPGKLLLKYNQYLNGMYPFIQRHVDRFNRFPGSNSNGIRMLDHVLRLLDDNWMMKNDDITIYMNYLQYEKKNLDGVFSRVMTGKNYTKMFIRSKSNTVPEYFIPVSDIRTLNRIPMNGTWLDYLNTCRPLKLIYHDSEEYTLNLLQDRVIFKDNPPSYAIFTVDTISLSLMYNKWEKEVRINEPVPYEEATKAYFIHKYVVSGLYFDLVDTWLVNQLDGILDGEDIVRLYSSKVKSSQYSHISNRYEEAFSELSENVNRVREKKITADRLVNSDLFFTGNLVGKLSELIYLYPTDELKGSYYLTLMKELPYIDLFYRIYSFEPSNHHFQKMLRDGGRKVDRILASRPWSRCVNKKVAESLEEQFMNFVRRYW